MAINYSNKLARMLRIMTVVQAGRPCTPDSLAAEFSVARRTVYRDLRTLREIGVPIDYCTETNMYLLRQDYLLPPVNLELAEALSIAVLARQLDADDGARVPFLDSARAALDKLLAKLPLRMREELGMAQDGGAFTIRLGPVAPGGGFESIFDALRHARARGVVVSCRYEKAGGAADGGDEEFDFEPYAMVFNVRTWYAIGRHLGRDALRTLRVDRFIRAVPTHRPYTIPADFRLSDYFGNAWRMIPGDRDYAVAIHFATEFAETVAATQWHHTQDQEWHPDGSVTLRFTVSGLDEIVWWILGYGPAACVHEPPELIDRIRSLASDTAARYAG